MCGEKSLFPNELAQLMIEWLVAALIGLIPAGAFWNTRKQHLKELVHLLTCLC